MFYRRENIIDIKVIMVIKDVQTIIIFRPNESKNILLLEVLNMRQLDAKKLGTTVKSICDLHNFRYYYNIVAQYLHFGACYRGRYLNLGTTVKSGTCGG